MNDTQKFTSEQFTKRLVSLCLRSGLDGMPKAEVDQQVLFKSAALLIGTAGPLSEKEVSEKLQIWLTDVCVIKNFDRVTMRRYMVDAGYLTRSNNGASYQVAQPGPRPELFDEDVDKINPVDTIRSAREEMERRKQAFIQKSKGA